MSYATIRTALKTAIEAVPGISGGDGSVQDHEPHVTRLEDYISKFGNTAGTAINGWTITRERLQETMQDPGFRFQLIHEVVVRGRFGVMETSGTEVTFQDLIDAVASAVRGSVTIWVECPEDSDNALQAEIIGHESHGSFLVHLAELRFSVEEFEVITS